MHYHGVQMWILIILCNIYIVFCCCAIYKPATSKVHKLQRMLGILCTYTTECRLSRLKFFLHFMRVWLYVSSRGDVKVKILHVHNASNFSARLLEHTDVGGHPVIIPDEYLTVNMAMYSHYSDEKNRYWQYKGAFVNYLL